MYGEIFTHIVYVCFFQIEHIRNSKYLYFQSERKSNQSLITSNYIIVVFVKTLLQFKTKPEK